MTVETRPYILSRIVSNEVQMQHLLLLQRSEVVIAEHTYNKTSVSRISSRFDTASQVPSAFWLMLRYALADLDRPAAGFVVHQGCHRT
jgi:hypothetical protein